MWFDAQINQKNLGQYLVIGYFLPSKPSGEASLLTDKIES